MLTFCFKGHRYYFNQHPCFRCELQRHFYAMFVGLLSGLLFISLSIGQEISTPNPLAAEEAAASMKVPEGFRVSLFAAEPDVRQPIGFCIDDRGRLWVAEAYNYPTHGTKPGDRILIFEDSDNDGRFDKRTVFYDQLNYVTGIEVGFGGVWVMSPPCMFFIPDRNNDDVPDSKPDVLLDGFGNHANSHNLANGFAWGPDGWLYGTHGRTNWSRIAKPGTPDSQRSQFDGGVYRYHPIRHVWEPYADGTTNPWGIDWDEFGEGFVCNCVNPHLFHVIQGAHYEPWRNRESSRYAYQRIDTIADHLHYVGQGNIRAGLGSESEDLAGGGHAHCGTMIYLGDNWPTEYRNSVLMNNIHGKRINRDTLQKSGSGYIASHAPDLLRSLDPWHMGVTLQYGPDGGVFLLDWNDTGECHSVRNTQRETGRIFKVTFGQPRAASIHLATQSDTQLAQLHLHPNEWYVRHARRNLQERMLSRPIDKTARQQLLDLAHQSPNIKNRLRAFWTLHAIGALDEKSLMPWLQDSDPHVRSWAIRFMCESGTPSQPALQQLSVMAKQDTSPVVRLYLASALQRLPLQERWQIAQELVRHREDDADQNLPSMYWYAIEPLVDEDWNRFASLAKESGLSLIRKHIARRIASLDDNQAGLRSLIEIAKTFSVSGESTSLNDLMLGMLEGLEGKRSIKMPEPWSSLIQGYRPIEGRLPPQSMLELGLIFGDKQAQSMLRDIAQDRSANVTRRTSSLQSLINQRSAGLAPFLHSLLDDDAISLVTLRGLAVFEDTNTAALILSRYANWPAAQKQEALQTLASRHDGAMALLSAMESNQIARADVNAYIARQIQSLGDPKIDGRLRRVWGDVRSTSADKSKQIASLKKSLSGGGLLDANLDRGKSLFQKNCSNCHRLFGEGGTIGPDITGSQRSNLDYILENIVDPSASVASDFRLEIVALDSGQVVSGIIVDESDSMLQVQTPNQRMTIPKSEITDRKTSSQSLMPDGLLQNLSAEQIRDMVGYLSAKNPL